MKKEAVIVTGSSSGIGLETAVFLAEFGFRVYATMRDLGRNRDLKAEADRRSVHLNYLRLDVTHPDSIRSAVDTVADDSGSIYGLVNNAGINIRGFFEDLSEEEMRRVFDVNVLGTMAVTRAVLPFMRSVRRGRIIVMSSVGGQLPSFGSAAYCSSKFALEGFSRTLAQEIKPFGLSVSIVEPGFVKTELFGRNRHIAARAMNPQGPYHKWFVQLENLTDKLANSPIASPRTVAVAVLKALTAENPHRTYVVGRRTKVLIALRRYLSDRFFERIWMWETTRRLKESEPSPRGTT